MTFGRYTKVRIARFFLTVSVDSIHLLIITEKCQEFGFMNVNIKHKKGLLFH